jgi:hypothetical protein
MASDSCALAARVGEPDAFTQATGFSYISGPPTVQSSRFLNVPGSAPAYSDYAGGAVSTRVAT